MSSPTSPTPPVKADTTLRFPLATLSQVRREVAHQLGRVRHAKPLFLLALVLLGLGAYAGVLVPQLMGRIVDVVMGDIQQSLWPIGAGLMSAAIAGAVMSACGFYLVARLSERVIANLRQDMVGTALGLPTHRVEDAGTGDLVSRSTDDVAELSAAVTETVPTLSTSLFTVIATVIALFTLDWQFLIIPVIVAPVYYLAARLYLSKAPRRYADERAAMAERARRVLEAIRGRATVRAFSMEGRMHTEIGNASWSVVRKGIRARTTMLGLNAWMLGAEFLMLTIALSMGYHLVSTGALTVGAVTGAVLMIIRLRGPLNTFMRVLDVVQSGYASLARVVGVVTDPPVPVPDSGVDAPQGRVELRAVSFGYGDSWAVRDIDVTIGPGETVAIVGASGAGKTTVAALVAGLRVPDAGVVLVDDRPVSSLSDRERIARLAMVSQEVHVFSGTLRQDMTLAKPDATDAELLAALDLVHARPWFDRLPEGLDTVVGARGIQLDPVAAQQLALARVLLLDPAVVIMDEATAEAGSAGAGALEDAADEVTRGRSALVVAHRLDQAARADNILVMDSGQVVEQGTHDQLLARGGIYHRLWSAWTAGRQETDDVRAEKVHAHRN
ncbi:ABC transporter ATP-binding protein [Rhodococcus sp. HNM0563]|uniref:ABC transporter ATP-binding protein n=1 Tax=unclassified Rhodococcus (in: high G+C Gram-positive bacteria) TaxID=192944 RepID=UPI00146E3F44|nr:MULTISPECIES: ABC transporter ATP-binding protein [unclassified Rhodococcus (in: high G+C Gram-positive bacteria)]MCK0089780.1 ABC transporter ATP-binding protein/permease [Rhodococcus sp. F64268]NLU62271.1 ABC transporter ATP-binding protein [Rhodococcus sp. HNM0563]